MRTFLALWAVCVLAGVRPAAALDCSHIEGPGSDSESADPGTDNPSKGYEGENFRADVVAVFHKIRSVSLAGDVVLRYAAAPEKDRDCRGGGAMARPSGAGVKATVIICTNLRDFVRNREQLVWVMGHEFAHLELEHAQKLQQARSEAVRQWMQGKSKSYWGRTMGSQIDNDMEKDLCPDLNALSRSFETEADRLGVELAHQAGFDPRHGAWAILQGRDLYWAAQAREREIAHPMSKTRADQIYRQAEALADQLR